MGTRHEKLGISTLMHTEDLACGWLLAQCMTAWIINEFYLCAIIPIDSWIKQHPEMPQAVTCSLWKHMKLKFGHLPGPVAPGRTVIQSPFHILQTPRLSHVCASPLSHLKTLIHYGEQKRIHRCRNMWPLFPNNSWKMVNSYRCGWCKSTMRWFPGITAWKSVHLMVFKDMV